jgi:heme/copper-type cytochrome/quinol oxidase subunit 2
MQYANDEIIPATIIALFVIILKVVVVIIILILMIMIVILKNRKTKDNGRSFQRGKFLHLNQNKDL